MAAKKRATKAKPKTKTTKGSAGKTAKKRAPAKKRGATKKKAAAPAE